MTVEQTELPGVLLITPRAFEDNRGAFLETYNARRYAEAGITDPFVQDNVSYSTSGVIRGLHYQVPNPQAKLIQVVSGEVFDVAVDIRKGSPHFGKWVGRVLSAKNHAQLLIPEGFAHGFAVLGDHAILSYKCSRLYEPTGDAAIIWNDPDIRIDWPYEDPILSEKDLAAYRLAEVSSDRLPSYT